MSLALCNYYWKKSVVRYGLGFCLFVWLFGLVFKLDHLILFSKMLCCLGVTMYIYVDMYPYIIIVICIYHVLISFDLVAVVEGSNTTEIDKEEKDQTTQDPDLTTGKCPPTAFRINTWYFNLWANKSNGLFLSLFFLIFLFVNHSLVPWLSASLVSSTYSAWSCHSLLIRLSLCPLANFPFLLWLLICGYSSNFTSPSLILPLILKGFIHPQNCSYWH